MESDIHIPPRKIHTVSELTEIIKNLLEREHRSVWIEGEISNFKAAPSGHSYFTLKDEASQIRCVMFRGQNQFLKFKPEDGLKVIAWGRLSVYTPRGEYQLILDTMEPRGIGSLMMAFEQLRKKLAAEGLFDEFRKRPLPRFPRSVGLVTSREGAAVRDMIRIIRRRSPYTHVLLSSTVVQGDRAPAEIVESLNRLCRSREVDVIIIGRGGGSIEDLWAFNDESVVRATAECPLPIISAVGHETDFTLTDFAADVRASTPSAAAEIVVPDVKDLTEDIRHVSSRLKNAMARSHQQNRHAVEALLKRLYDPRRKIVERRQYLDGLTMRLEASTRRRLARLRTECLTGFQRLRPEYLQKTVHHKQEELQSLSQRLIGSAQRAVERARADTQALASRLDALSPLAVLSRGYAIASREDSGEILKDAKTVETGATVRVRLHRGSLQCSVTNVDPAETSPAVE